MYNYSTDNLYLLTATNSYTKASAGATGVVTPAAAARDLPFFLPPLGAKAPALFSSSASAVEMLIWRSRLWAMGQALNFQLYGRSARESTNKYI